MSFSAKIFSKLEREDRISISINSGEHSFFRYSFIKIMRLRSLSYDASQCKGSDVTVLWLRVPQWSVMVDKPSVHFFTPFKSRYSFLA